MADFGILLERSEMRVLTAAQGSVAPARFPKLRNVKVDQERSSEASFGLSSQVPWGSTFAEDACASPARFCPRCPVSCPEQAAGAARRLLRLEWGRN